MRSHLHEVNSLLIESSLMTEHGFMPGCENRCRIAIRDSFANFPDIQRQVALWFSRGAGWGQIQQDLNTTFASARDVALAYNRSLSAISFGPFFCTEVRDVYSIYYSVFTEHPHRLISFVDAICGKLPAAIRDKTITRLARESSDEYWQLARPVWHPNSSSTVLGLIDELVRVDLSLRDFNQSIGKPRHQGSTDKINKVGESDRKSGEPPQSSQWLMQWVGQFQSVWVVHPTDKDFEEKLAMLKKKGEVKGPLRRGHGKPGYYLIAFQNESLAKEVLAAVLPADSFRPFQVTKNT